jgi:hypothetical protein
MLTQSEFGQYAGQHPVLLELLEVPQLMDTCVRNGNYDDALDLRAFISKMAVMHPNLEVGLSSHFYLLRRIPRALRCFAPVLQQRCFQSSFILVGPCFGVPAVPTFLCCYPTFLLHCVNISVGIFMVGPFPVWFSTGCVSSSAEPVFPTDHCPSSVM